MRKQSNRFPAGTLPYRGRASTDDYLNGRRESFQRLPYHGTPIFAGSSRKRRDTESEDRREMEGNDHKCTKRRILLDQNRIYVQPYEKQDRREPRERKRSEFCDLNCEERRSRFTAGKSATTDDGASLRYRPRQKFPSPRKIAKHGAATTERIFDHLVLKRQDGTFSHEYNWDFESEQNELKKRRQEVVWLENMADEVGLAGETINLENWMKVGELKLNLTDEATFSDSSIVREIFLCKTELTPISSHEIRNANLRSTPFEHNKPTFLPNKTSIKIAFLDFAFDYLLTDSKSDRSEGSLVKKDEVFTFAEVNASSVGLSHYIQWKKRGLCIGYSLNGHMVPKFEEHKLEYREMMHYIGHCDLYDNKNQEDFQDYVLNETRGRGVHLAIADGGVSKDGEENIQEILCQPMFLCQFAVALMVLKEGGNFACKLFDLFTPFSVGLVYLMWLCFEKISIFKPVLSRPSNSERYIICCGRKKNIEAIVDYCRKVSLKMTKLYPVVERSKSMVLEIVPLKVLLGNEQFFNYIKNSNDLLGGLQLMSLMKIKTFATNVTLRDPHLGDLEKFNLDKIRLINNQINISVSKGVPTLWEKSLQPLFINYKLQYLNEQNVDEIVHARKDVLVMPITSRERHLLVSLGRGGVFKILMSELATDSWIICEHVELPENTILDVEFFDKKKSLTILVNDVLIWCGNNFTGRSLVERLKLIDVLLKGVVKKVGPHQVNFQVKPHCFLQTIESEFRNEIPRNLEACIMRVLDEEDKCIRSKGVCLIKMINECERKSSNKGRRHEGLQNLTGGIKTSETPRQVVESYLRWIQKCFFWCSFSNDEDISLLQYIISCQK